MDMRALAVAIMLLLPLSGCLTPEGPAPIDRPVDWDQGVEMVFVGGFRAHSADETRELVLPDNVTLTKPAYCGAYQDGVRKARDTCMVVTPFTNTYPEGSWEWGIRAEWDGRGEDLIEQEQDESRRTVVAFDADGVPVAFWDTKAHPDAAMAIE